MKKLIETNGFHRQLSKELNSEQIDELLANIAENPFMGKPIPETGNIRYTDVQSNRKKQIRICYLSDKTTSKIIMLGIYKTTEENLLNCALHKLSLEIGATV